MSNSQGWMTSHCSLACLQEPRCSVGYIWASAGLRLLKALLRNLQRNLSGNKLARTLGLRACLHERIFSIGIARATAYGRSVARLCHGAVSVRPRRSCQ